MTPVKEYILLSVYVLSNNISLKTIELMMDWHKTSLSESNADSVGVLINAVHSEADWFKPLLNDSLKELTHESFLGNQSTCTYRLRRSVLFVC